MSSISEAGHCESSDNIVASSTTYDNEKPATADKRQATTMTRRMSFSMTRPWSSYAENYSSCLSNLRRNSSVQNQRKGSFQSSQASCLSRSLDGEQLKNLKVTSEDKQGTFKVSAFHARPFHQRRWSSPVAFSVVKSGLASPRNNIKNKTGINRVIEDPTDKKTGEISEDEEVAPSRMPDEPSVSADYLYRSIEKGSVQADRGLDTLSSDQISRMTENLPNNKCVHDDSKKDDNEQISRKSSEKSLGNSKEKMVKVIVSKITSTAKPYKENNVQEEEDNIQKRNIYTEIKKNTKWSNSKRFRRRHHTIHGDSRHFLNHNLFTIAEQSVGSFDATYGKVQTLEANGKGTLKTRRSKSLPDDLATLSNDFKELSNNGVVVQQLHSKSRCVSVGGSNDSQKGKRGITVKCQGSNDIKNNQTTHTKRSVQVNVQTFGYEAKPEFRSVICSEQARMTNSQHDNQTVVSTAQHAVFTQAKTRWASITISQV